MARSVAYFFDGASDPVETLLMLRADRQMEGVSRWPASVVLGATIGSGTGVFVRPDAADTMYGQAKQHAYDWSEIRTGVWFGKAIRAET